MKLNNIIQSNTNYQVREETHQGRPHLVVPVVMMVEGVHNGSHGALLHPASELGRYGGAMWNGIPIVIHHPTIEGVQVSANDPRIIDNEKVGTVYNTYMDNNKLKAEAWFDIQALEQSSPSTLQRIRNNEVLEVSVGVFTDDEFVEGTWNDEQYIAIAHNHRPDHLALLPDTRGACSVSDGCGLHANEKGGNDDMKIDEQIKSMKALNAYGVATHSVEINVNETEYRSLVHDLQRKLDRMDNGDRVHFLEAVFNDRIIYKVARSADGSEEFFEQNYETNDEEGTVEFTGFPQKVEQQVNYVPTQNEESFKNQVLNFFKTKKGGNKMDGKQNVQNNCSQEKVNSLIANAQTKFAESDREFLQGLNEEQLDKLFPIEPKPNTNEGAEGKTTEKKEESGNAQPQPTQNQEGEKKITAEDIMKAFSEQKQDPMNFVNSFFPAEVAEQINSGLKLQKERRQELVRGITNNSNYGEEELKNWSVDGLQKLHDNLMPKGNFVGNGHGGYQANTDPNNGIEPMLPTGYGESNNK